MRIGSLLMRGDAFSFSQMYLHQHSRQYQIHPALVKDESRSYWVFLICLYIYIFQKLLNSLAPPQRPQVPIDVSPAGVSIFQ